MTEFPFKIDDLLRNRIPEGSRIEFKKTWDERIQIAVVHTISAFANDFQNLNGGYIVLGVEEKDGKPLLPPHGLNDLNVDEVQREIRVACLKIDPAYPPQLVRTEFEGKELLIVWCPPGELRPYSAPDRLNLTKGEKWTPTWYVRIGSETVEARGTIRTQLFEQTAKVPYDDRVQHGVALNNISETILLRYLRDVNSRLMPADTSLSVVEVLTSLRLVKRNNGSIAPVNAALLLFTDDPERFLPGARVEIVQFGEDGDLIVEQRVIGPIQDQIRNTLAALNGIVGSVNQKVAGQAEAVRTIAFPYDAMEEAIANAILHRGYDNPEPTKVYLYPNRMEITSYPGPVPGIQPEHFLPNASPPPVPLRNRRIGDFLKDLRLVEARGTGIPTILRKMRDNGSPEPRFDFDAERTYFRVTLPAHPDYVIVHVIREAGNLWARGEREKAIAKLESAIRGGNSSGVVYAQYIEYLCSVGDYWVGQRVLEEFGKLTDATYRHLPYLALAKGYLDHGKRDEARELMAAVPRPTTVSDRIELAILAKRAGLYQDAHAQFEAIVGDIQTDPKALHEFAQTKYQLAGQVRSGKNQRYARLRLNREAVDLLRRVIQLSDQPTRKAWANFDLARTLHHLHESETEIESAYRYARELLPSEHRFESWWNSRNH